MRKPEPNLIVHTSLDVRAVARVVHLMEKHNVRHDGSYSAVARWCMERLAEQSSIGDIDFYAALEFLGSRMFSMKQLQKGGKGVKIAIQRECEGESSEAFQVFPRSEDLTLEQKAKIEARAKEIEKVMEGGE